MMITDVLVSNRYQDMGSHYADLTASIVSQEWYYAILVMGQQSIIIQDRLVHCKFWSSIIEIQWLINQNFKHQTNMHQFIAWQMAIFLFWYHHVERTKLFNIIVINVIASI